MNYSLSFTDRVHYAESPEVLVSLTVGACEVDLVLLVDTGAECSLLDGIHARAAGLDIFQGRPRAFQGFLGARTVAYQHPATLRVGSVLLEGDLAFSTQPLVRQILGRDLLQHLRLGLDHQAGELYLALRG